MRTALFFVLLIPAILLLSCTQERAKSEVLKYYPITGQVLRVDTKLGTASIKHETIRSESGELWMEAMTMDFPVKDRGELAKLREGVRIRARLTQRPSDYEYWIDQIQVQ